MKPANDILHALLQELSIQRFNNFILFIKVFNSKKSSKKIIKIAVTLKQQKNFDETSLKKQLGKSYKELKSKTYYLILNFMRIEYKDNSFIDVHSSIDYAHLMQDRSHWNEAVRFYNKAQNWAQLNNVLIYELLILGHKSWSLYKTYGDIAPVNAIEIAKQNLLLSEKHVIKSKIYLYYTLIAEIIMKTLLLRNTKDLETIDDTLNKISAIIPIDKIDRHNLLMAQGWCLQLKGKHQQALSLEQQVFKDISNTCLSNKAEFKTLIVSAYMNFLSVCLFAKNEEMFNYGINKYCTFFSKDFSKNPLLELIYLTYSIQKAKCFNENLTFESVQYLEDVYLRIPQKSIDIAIKKSSACTLYYCYTRLKQYDKAKKYCEETMKQKITVGLRKDFVEIANLYYMVILFEEAIHVQLHKTRYYFENNYIHIHAKQYYERIRKSRDNYSFDLLFIGFFRKLPKSVTKIELHSLFIKLHSETLILKSSPENQYIQNLMLLLNFEEWMLEKIKLFQLVR